MKKMSVTLLTVLFAATITHSSWAMGDVNVGGEGIKEVSLPGMGIGISQDRSLTPNALPEGFLNNEGNLGVNIGDETEGLPAVQQAAAVNVAPITTIPQLQTQSNTHAVAEKAKPSVAAQTRTTSILQRASKRLASFGDRLIGKTPKQNSNIESLTANGKDFDGADRHVGKAISQLNNSQDTHTDTSSFLNPIAQNATKVVPLLIPKEETPTSRFTDQPLPPMNSGVIVDGKFPTAALKVAFKTALNQVRPLPSGVELTVLNSPMWGDNPQIRIRVNGHDIYWEYLYHSEANLIRVRHPWIWPMMQLFHRKPSDDLSKRFVAALTLAHEGAAIIGGDRHSVKESQQTGSKSTTLLSKITTQKQRNSQFWERILIGAVIVSAVGLALLIAYIIHIAPIILALESM